MYAQKLEGDEWIGEMMDKGKVDKMSGESGPNTHPHTSAWLGSRNGARSREYICRAEGNNTNESIQINNWDRCTSLCKQYGNSS